MQANGAGAAYGAAGHLFTRDPASYLVGVTGGVVRGPTGTLYAIGPEAELYLGDLSLEGWAGYAHLNYENILQPDLSGAFVVADVAYYVVEDWRVSIGGSHLLGYNSLRLGTEYQFRNLSVPLSVTGDFKYGQDGNYTAMLGLKGYLGGDSEKSLISRHREDDPPNRVLSLFSAAGGLLSAAPPTPGAIPPPVPSDFDDEASCLAAGFAWDGEAACVYPGPV
ncbi:MAG: hypothetical protein EON59_09680 [Alphaproteobacteria bacterium]|nr:MAG: hypothetical protein EON59_09680 [Alphaproteobacteria bacterium]